MRKKFCCDASKHLYETYYLDQSGSGIPVFSGSRGQKGHGLGSLLGGLFRSAMPMIKRGLATFGKHALKTGLEIANDVVSGESVKQSAKRRISQGIKQFAKPENFINQSGSGRKRSRRKKTDRRKKRRKYNDIFG